MLTRKRPEVILANLTIAAQGVSEKVKITYKNLNEDQFNELIEGKKLGEFLLELIVEWESEFPLTLEGLAEAEKAIPGLLKCLLNGFNIAREASIVKN